MAARDGGVVLVSTGFKPTQGFARTSNKLSSPVRYVRPSPKSVSSCSRAIPVRSRGFRCIRALDLGQTNEEFSRKFEVRASGYRGEPPGQAVCKESFVGVRLFWNRARSTDSRRAEPRTRVSTARSARGDTEAALPVSARIRYSRPASRSTLAHACSRDLVRSRRRCAECCPVSLAFSPSWLSGEPAERIA